MIHYSFSNLVPKKKNTWVFGAWFGKRYSDNPKVFFEYVCKHHPEITAVWISNEKDVVNKIRKLGYKACLSRSPEGILTQYRADKVFVCTSAHDDLYAPTIGRKTKIINFWHGIPIKKIMYDAFSESLSGEKYKNIWGKLEIFLTPYNENRNDIIIATSIETQELLANAFQLTKQQTIISGFPRNDVFYSPKQNQKKAGEKFQCLYVPTFRGEVGSEFNLFESYGFNVELIDSVFYANGIILVLRFHPFNRPSAELCSKISATKCIRIDETQDLYETITSYDLLITDYSSCYLDFILSKKPVLFSPFDLNSYMKNDRNLYYDYESVTLPPYSYNWNDLLENIIKVKNDQYLGDYKVKYENLLKRFHNQLPYENIYSKNVFEKVISM